VAVVEHPMDDAVEGETTPARRRAVVPENQASLGIDG
jgi:hypothetical protein